MAGETDTGLIVVGHGTAQTSSVLAPDSAHKTSPASAVDQTASRVALETFEETRQAALRVFPRVIRLSSREITKEHDEAVIAAARACPDLIRKLLEVRPISEKTRGLAALTALQLGFFNCAQTLLENGPIPQNDLRDALSHFEQNYPPSHPIKRTLLQCLERFETNPLS